jgi:hypothetical protein
VRAKELVELRQLGAGTRGLAARSLGAGLDLAASSASSASSAAIRSAAPSSAVSAAVSSSSDASSARRRSARSASAAAVWRVLSSRSVIRSRDERAL